MSIAASRTCAKKTAARREEKDMRSMVEVLTHGVVGVMFGALLAAGCAGVDEATDQKESGTPVETTEGISVQEESLTSVDMVDCSICATARACCNAVSTRASYCDNFNAESCARLDPGRQRTTKLNCLVQLRTTISAWRLAGREPPSECRIPGE
jgi:hypothetical protein